MKINEIAIPKKISSEYSKFVKGEYPAFSNLTKKLAKLGWKVISHGHFSAVYENPSKSYVLKINKQVDEGYQRYVNFIERNKNNRYLPKIVGKEMFLDPEEKYFVYFIEKLEPYTNRSVIKLISYIAERSRLFHEYDSLQDIISYMTNTQQRLVEEVNKKYPRLLQTIYNIGKFSEIQNIHLIDAYIDIRYGNVMQRADGTPVITDPYC